MVIGQKSVPLMKIILISDHDLYLFNQSIVCLEITQPQPFILSAASLRRELLSKMKFIEATSETCGINEYFMPINVW